MSEIYMILKKIEYEEVLIDSNIVGTTIDCLEVKSFGFIQCNNILKMFNYVDKKIFTSIDISNIVFFEFCKISNQVVIETLHGVLTIGLIY